MAAASARVRSDLDRDGLTDQEELVLGTLPYVKDTDGDGFSDLEERARRSNPRDRAAIPQPGPFSMNTCASLEDGVISLATVLYSADGGFGNAELRIGVVLRGRVFSFSPRNFANVRRSLEKGSDTTSSVGKVDVAIPESLVQQLGQVQFFSIVSSRAANPPPPLVSLVQLTDFSGVIVQVEEPDDAMALNSQGKGVVYRPLAGGDQIPSSWSGGEICFQRTALVGMKGVSAVHEIESSDCQPMDTYCSPTDCAAAVGKSFERPDPAALAGG